MKYVANGSGGRFCDTTKSTEASFLNTQIFTKLLLSPIFFLPGDLFQRIILHVFVALSPSYLVARGLGGTAGMESVVEFGLELC